MLISVFLLIVHTLVSANGVPVPAIYHVEPIFPRAIPLSLDSRIKKKSGNVYCARLKLTNTNTEAHQGWTIIASLKGSAVFKVKGVESNIIGDKLILSPTKKHEIIYGGKSKKISFCTDGKSSIQSAIDSLEIKYPLPTAQLVTSYEVEINKSSKKNKREKKGRKRHDGRYENHDEEDNTKYEDHHSNANYCIEVKVRNIGPSNVYDWRLGFDLKEDEIIKIKGGVADAHTGNITVQPKRLSRIKRNNDREIEYCAISKRLIEISPPDILISNPLLGAVVQGNTISITGTYVGPVNTGITVNNIPAVTDGNNFYAIVPLTSGLNNIKAVATTPLGNQVVNEIEITASGGDIIRFVVDNNTGLMPTQAVFRYQYSGTQRATSVTADLDGDGVDDFSSENPTGSITFTYQNSGTYIANITVIDELGQIYTKELFIRVYSKNEIDEIVALSYDGMIDSLAGLNTQLSLNYVSLSSRERYRPVFETLAINFPDIISGWSSLQQSKITSEYAEYGINTSVNGIDRLFLIYFIPDDDGVWRMDSM